MDDDLKTIKIDHLMLRNDTAANWASKNPVLAKGEMGIENDTRKFKFGNGINAWNDLPYAVAELTLANILDAGTAAAKDVGNAAGNVPVLGVNGKLDPSIMPDLAITDVYVVADEAAMLALDAEQGDFAIRTDEAKTYILAANTPADLAAWKPLRTPDCKVLSVNNKTGAITLTTTDMPEGINLYFTEERATENFNTNFALKSIKELSDGTNVIASNDTITIDGGNA